MSFMVTLRQSVVPDHDQPTMVIAPQVTTEMSSDTLQLRLIKDIHGIVSINGQKLTLPQKEALRALGRHYDVTDLKGNGGASVLVTARREGHMRTWAIEQNGVGRYVDGHGPSMNVTRQDPLNSAPWGDGVLTEGV